MIITIAEARSYAHDFESTDEDMQSYILTAEKYIAEGVGTVDPADPRVKLLAKLIVCELDDVRTLSGAEANSTRHLVESIKRQLRTVARVSKLDTNGTAP
ncbi:MAG: head-tail connector protein [Oscillospiraceae bacterium]